MAWKEMFAGAAATKLGILGNVASALILLTVIGLTLYVFVEIWDNNSSRRGRNFFEYLTGLTGFLGTGMLLLLSARAAGLFTQEKERDTWLSLLATPLTGDEIVRGKMLGNLYSLRWAFGVLLSCWMLGFFMAPESLVTILGLSVVFLLVAWYVTNVGLFFSLRSKTTLRAMGSTLATLVFTGGGYLFCCCMVMASAGGGADGEIALAPCIPYLLVYPALSFAESGVWEDTEMSIAFCLGVVGYLVAAIGFYRYLANEFDTLVGRTGR